MVKELDLEKYLKQFKDINVKNLVPLIKYDQNWSLPDKYKIESYDTIIKNNKSSTIVKRLRLFGRIYTNCERPNTKKWYNGSLRKSGLKFIYKNKELWVVLKSNWPTANKDLPIKCLVKDNKLCFMVPKNYIGIWYEYGRERINFIIIPKILELRKEFWEVFGILYGEMLRKGYSTRVSNTSPTVIKHILNYFNKSQLIKFKDWTMGISINKKDIFSYNKNYEEKIKKYWLSMLNIKELKIKKIRQYNLSSTLNPNFGQIDLGYDNKSLNKIVNYLIKYIKENVLKNKQNSMDFIRGLIAAEGSSDRNENKALRAVRIASKLEEERLFYQALLKKIGIKSKLYYNNHNIASSGIENFILYLKYDLLGLNEKREETFIKRFCNLSLIKSSLLLLNKSLTVNEIVKILNFKDYRNVNRNFSRLTKLGYLKRIYTEEGFRYSLSKEFKSLLYPLMQANGTTLITRLPIPTS